MLKISSITIINGKHSFPGKRKVCSLHVFSIQLMKIETVIKEHRKLQYDNKANKSNSIGCFFVTKNEKNPPI